MTVSALTELFLMDMGYARNDTAEDDVVAEYAGVLLRWLNEGYARAVCRLHGREAVGRLDPLRSEEDEPVKLDEALHPLLADYAAARAQEARREAWRRLACPETRRRLARLQAPPPPRRPSSAIRPRARSS